MEADTREATAWPSAPQYNWKSPKAVAQFKVEALGSTVSAGFFFRSARWSVHLTAVLAKRGLTSRTPDATCILTTGEDRVIRVFDV